MKLIVPADRATSQPLVVNVRDTEAPERYIQTRVLVAMPTEEDVIRVLKETFGDGEWLGNIASGEGRFELVPFEAEPQQLAESMGALGILNLAKLS